MKKNESIIIYNTDDWKTSVALYAKDWNIWMNQNQIAELFDTSKQNIWQHIQKILEEWELSQESVVKNYLPTEFPLFKVEDFRWIIQRWYIRAR